MVSFLREGGVPSNDTEKRRVKSLRLPHAVAPLAWVERQDVQTVLAGVEQALQIVLYTRNFHRSWQGIAAKVGRLKQG